MRKLQSELYSRKVLLVTFDPQTQQRKSVLYGEVFVFRNRQSKNNNLEINLFLEGVMIVEIFVH